jgi:hypothetical protein
MTLNTTRLSCTSAYEVPQPNLRIFALLSYPLQYWDDTDDG